MPIQITDEKDRWVLQTAAWSAAVTAGDALGHDTLAGTVDRPERYAKGRREVAESMAAFGPMAELTARIEDAEMAR